MSTAASTTLVTLMTGSLGPSRHVAVTIPIADGAIAAPLLIEDPAPDLPGVWRRVTADGAAPAYVRVARIAAP